jgi:hypothetical protein
MAEQALTYSASQATASASPSLEDELRMLVQYFEESEDMTQQSRQVAENCRNYYDGYQYTAAEIAALKKRGQAPVYDNHIRRKIDSLCGLERRTRTDPKAFPRNPQDEKTAEAATDSLRYVADQNRFNAIRSEVFNDILVEGTGAAEVVVEEKPGGDLMVMVKRVPWDRFFYDPHSRMLDFEDAIYKGIVIWLDASQAKRDYPGREDAIDTTMIIGVQGETYDDRPKYTWCDSKRKRVRVVQIHYYQDGEWWVATFTKGGFLVDPVVSPYQDKWGRSACPIIARSGYIDRENDRYGHCKDLIPLQDEINKRRSKALHLMSQRQTFGNKRAIVDVKAAKAEMAKPDGHVQINDAAEFGKDFGVIPTGDMAQGQVLMLDQALASMNATGANSALQGKDERAQSGVALQTKIQAGATELEPQTDGLREWTHQVYEAMWMRVRQFWTGEKWVRVTDDDRNMKWVGLNKPVTLQDKISQLQPQEQQALIQQLQLQPGDPRLQQVIEVENGVSGLDVDIIVDDGPDVATLQGEQFQLLAELAGTPQGQQEIPFTAIIKASSLRNKDTILDEIEKRREQMQQSQQQAMEEAKQLGRAEAEADIAKKQAEAQKAAAQTRQIEVDTQIAGIQALTPQQPIYQ